MVEEARLEPNESGLAPVTKGWFVVNVRDAAWVANERLGFTCRFEGPEAQFDQLGINVRVLEPGKPNGRYHSESAQEAILVLSGECILLVEEQERRLGPWDFVHLPPDTHHIVVGAGEEPCVVLMAGARPHGKTLHYPVSELAARYDASVAQETGSPPEAYAGFPPIELRPPNVGPLPWEEPVG
jgi:uncharacterized cupin superfamily protein